MRQLLRFATLKFKQLLLQNNAPGSCGLRSGVLAVLGFLDLSLPLPSQIWPLPTSCEKESESFKLLGFFTRESKIKCSCA